MPEIQQNDDQLILRRSPRLDSKYSEYSYGICPAYCDCEFPKSSLYAGYRGPISDLVKCRCGEEDIGNHSIKWHWHKCPESDILLDENKDSYDCTFHPIYSHGTAIVRGEQPLAADMMHFWEIRVLTPLSGTDVMFGIGTDNVDLTEYKFHFASALGSNDQSWAFSYEGKIHHNGQQTTYGQKFSQGCVVGILLDRSRGQLEFFLNRRSLGVAFTNICNDPHVKLYPMVCSTAAKSAIRLINASSQIECLQLRAFRAMSKQPKALEELKRMPGLRNILNNYWFLAPPVRYSQQSRNSQFDMLDEAVLSNKSRRGRKQKLNDDDIDMDDLYRNAHKIALHQYGESDDEPTLNEYFDEYFHYLL
ncbi:SPRY domain-containing SOCS box protein 3 isoform X2 [Stomoxys calcitrans]|nr:SPRY domain-containing SOCS box protein 3 isoform X2 [Stomoxys calcitrans]XP_059216844.1 SPRY domain-containing SOCS box protein 3 isoform X2 [Stomoxys calcitrans]